MIALSRQLILCVKSFDNWSWNNWISTRTWISASITTASTALLVICSLWRILVVSHSLLFLILLRLNNLLVSIPLICLLGFGNTNRTHWNMAKQSDWFHKWFITKLTVIIAGTYHFILMFGIVRMNIVSKFEMKDMIKHIIHVIC